MINNYSQYKLRKIGNNKDDFSYCLTVPKQIASKFENVKFVIEITKNTIIYKSGMDLVELRENIKNYPLEKLN